MHFRCNISLLSIHSSFPRDVIAGSLFLLYFREGCHLRSSFLHQIIWWSLNRTTNPGTPTAKVHTNVTAMIKGVTTTTMAAEDEFKPSYLLTLLKSCLFELTSAPLTNLIPLVIFSRRYLSLEDEAGPIWVESCLLTLPLSFLLSTIITTGGKWGRSDPTQSMVLQVNAGDTVASSPPKK